MKDHNLFERINEKLTFSLRKRVPSILQSESSECGLACLAMISSYYGFNVDMLSLRQRFGISTQGRDPGHPVTNRGANSAEDARLVAGHR